MSSDRPGVFQRIARRAVLGKMASLQVGAVRLTDSWSGETEQCGDRATEPSDLSRVTVEDPEFYADVMCRGTIGAAEAYAAARWECDDLTRLMRVFLKNRDVLESMEGGFARLSSPLLRAFHAVRPNTRNGSRRNIAAHYDLGNDFFEAFLDPSMTYSSAVFDSPQVSLEEASTAKLDRLCRKLDLQPSDHLLEIGTGWGSMALHAAEHYGCRVTTTTISEQQFELAKRRVKERGLESRIELLCSDYRDLDGTFDKLVSVEMIEAVGHRFLDTFMATCSKLLRPDGAAALQVITMQDQFYDAKVREVDFIKRYIFPGSFIPSVTAVSNAMARSTDMRMFHLEDFGPHYAETLRRWRENLEDAWQRILELGYSDEFLRMWRYYLAYCEAGFLERFIGVSQILFTKPGCRLDPLLPQLVTSPRHRLGAAG